MFVTYVAATYSSVAANPLQAIKSYTRDMVLNFDRHVGEWFLLILVLTVLLSLLVMSTGSRIKYYWESKSVTKAAERQLHRVEDTLSYEVQLMEVEMLLDGLRPTV